MRTCYFAGHVGVGELVKNRLADSGVVFVDDASTADIIVMYFTSQMALEDACFDQAGLLQKAKEGTTVIDLSATTPSFTRELAAIASASKLRFVEAPLMFVDPTAHDAFGSKDNMACFVAGDYAQSDDAKLVLNALACTIYATGSEGSAQLMRASYTIQACASMVAAAESDALFRGVAMMPAGIGDAASGRAGALSPLAESLLHAVEEGRFSGPYTIEMLMGEMAAALTTAEEAEITLPLAESCMQIMELIAIIGGADKAPSALALTYRDQAEIEREGLDWKRAAQYAESGHVHQHDHDDDDDDDYESYDVDDFLGMAGLGLDDDLYDEDDWN